MMGDEGLFAVSYIRMISDKTQNLATLPLVGRPKIDFGRRNEVRPCSAAKLNTFYTNW